jgi:hypothetical protein
MRSARLAGLVVVLALAALPATNPVAAVAEAGLEGIPHYDHVVVLIEENEDFDSTFGPGSPAVFLNSVLRPMGTMDDQYYATGHVSLDNYIAMTSGQPDNPATGTDCMGLNLFTCAQGQLAMANGRNLGDQLDGVNVTWRQYSDGTTKPCVHADYSPAAGADTYQGDGGTPTSATGAGPDYADRHVPWLYYPNIVGDNPRCVAHLLPFTSLAADLAFDTLPGFSFITPDTCNDGHDAPCSGGGPGGLTGADAWLQGPADIQGLLSYLQAHKGLLIITLDEASISDISGCCHGGPGGTAGFGGRVGLLAIGPGVAPGGTIHTEYDHASLLRTIEDVFGVDEHLNNAGASDPMVDLFTAGTTSPDSPGPGTPGAGDPTPGANRSGGLPNTTASQTPASPPPAALLALVPLAAALGLRSWRRGRRP